MLRHLKRISVQFAPMDPRAASARELLQRVGCDKARKSNPDCVVEYKADETVPLGGARVELHFVDGEMRQLLTADHRIADILSIIQQKATESLLVSVMQDVKFDPFAAGNRVAAAPAPMEQTAPR